MAFSGLHVNCLRRREEFNFDGDFDGDYRRRTSGEEDTTSCPRPTSRESYCVPIPNSENDRYKGDRAVTEFAWKLFKNSNKQPNYALSPLSPQILLSYLAWVANGTTKNELVEANGFGNPKHIQNVVTSLTSQGSDPKKEILISTAFFVAEDIRYVSF